MNLITNRTSRDVDRWKVLRNRCWDSMSEAERAEWLGESDVVPSAARGMYTHKDLNRVESALKSVVARLRALGYQIPDMKFKTDWAHTDTVWSEDIERYYSNIKVVRDCITLYPSTPEAPTVDKKLDFEIANDIEQILVDICEILSKQTKSWYYVGEVFTGEV